MLRTTQEWQESVSQGLENLAQQIGLLSSNLVTLLKPNPVIKENLTTEIPISKQVTVIDDDSANFYNRMWIFAISQLTVFVMLTLVSYYFIQMMFGFWFGLSGSAFIFLDLLLIDKYALKGDTLGKIANNAIATVGFWAVIAFVFITCFAIGNTLISDPATGEEHKQASIERQYKNDSSATPEIDSVGFGSQGSTER